MKKTLILFTLLCAASALNGMDPTSLYELRRTGPEKMGSFAQLPKELHEEIKRDAIKKSAQTNELVTVSEVVREMLEKKYMKDDGK